MHARLNSHVRSDCILYGGLNWQVVVGIGGVKRLLAQARIQGRTHSVISGTSLKSFGALTQTNIEKRSLLTHHSAAACFARMTTKAAHAVVVNVGSAGFLLLAVSDGAVLVKGDQYFSDLETAQAAIHELSESSPKLGVRYIEDGDEFLNSLQEHRSLLTQLRPIRKRQVWRYGLLITLLLATLWFMGGSKSQLSGVSVSSVKQQPPVFEVAGSSYAVEAVLAEWYGLALQFGPWQLLSASCALAQPQQWDCALRMLNRDVSVTSDPPNLPGWELLTQKATEVGYQRTINYSESAHQSRSQGRQNSTQLQSLWRNYAHAFSTFHVSQSASMDKPNATDIQQKPTFSPGSLVFVEGPLRALVLVREAASELKNLRLELKVIADPSSSIKKSQLIFSLKGEQR